jgi:hypothetical protein
VRMHLLDWFWISFQANWGYWGSWKLAFLSEDGLSILRQQFAILSESIWHCDAEWIILSPPASGSQIVLDIPDIFAKVQEKQFFSLWRGNRDACCGSEFRQRCDDQEKTLTVILDTKGGFFEGFTLVKWESRIWNGKIEIRNNTRKADASLKSFLFRLKNADKIPGRRFVLKVEKVRDAIECASGSRPSFGDLYILWRWYFP